MKIVFMGTPGFALPALKALVSSEHTIAGVVTQPDRPRGRGREVAASPIKQVALESGLTVLQPENVNVPEFVETLRSLNPDLIVVVAFGQILKADVLQLPGYFCMNLHASLLPRYRGAAPIQRAIIEGETETGVTTMKMDAGMDTGDILLTQKVPVRDTDDAQTLHDTLSEAGAGLVLETIRRLEGGSLKPVPQDPGQASYAPKLKKEEGLMVWNHNAETLRNLVRGLTPWPGAYTFFHSKRLRVWRAETGPGAPEDRPGTIARVTGHGIEVGTGRGRLIITHLQPEGKNPMSVKSFLAGHPVRKGEHFDSSSTPSLIPTQ
ncbi:MAG: methionyl-tRNA formyltransferase [Nitrospinaceae bacterium]